MAVKPRVMAVMALTVVLVMPVHVDRGAGAWCREQERGCGQRADERAHAAAPSGDCEDWLRWIGGGLHP
jgi:hypothetical protein